MNANLYQILGVAPGAEDAVIRAAYRALMRMYHPDRNDDPNAQSRAREITAAFAVLGDPERRAAYDAGEIFGAHGASVDGAWYAPDRGAAPPMRVAGLASIAVALAVTLAFALPRAQPEPEALRSLAAYREITNSEPPVKALAAPEKRVVEGTVAAAVSVASPSSAVSLPSRQPVAVAPRPTSPTPSPPAREIAQAARPKPPAPVKVAETNAPAPKPVVAPSCPQCSDRRAQVERMATGFLKQSLEHADFQKQQLLLSARNRSATSRNLCHSDDCVTEAYMRQIRDTTTIMEGRIPNP